MADDFNFEFLRLEFKNVYYDIKDLKEQDSIEDISKSADILISDIISSIYKYKNIFYDNKLHYTLSLDNLERLKILPKTMVQKIVFLAEGICDSYNYEINGYIKGNLNYKNKELLFEVVSWLALNFGHEDYLLFVDKLSGMEKKIFEKYIKPKKEERKLVASAMLTEDEKKERASELVELGEKYYFGRGIKKNYREAFKYFRLAAKYGDEYGQSYLGVFYDKGVGVKRDYFLAAKWYYKAAIRGNSFAQYSLAMLYLDGNGVAKDLKKSLIWFQKSSESDYSPAFYQLGKAYYNGTGVEKDFDIAFKWYQRAANENLAAAQYALSFMYKNGEGCEKNIIKAYYWIEKAAENEYEDAYYIVGKSYLEGLYFDQNFEKAFYYLNKGYKELDSNCIESLATMYLNGFYVEKSVIKALDFLNKGIELGDISLYFKVGKIYETQKLIKQAIDSYEEGHELGDVKCTQRLGIIYYNGEGIERDLEKAIEYMEIAAEKKASHAMYMLGIAYLRLNRFGDKTIDKSKELLEEAFQLGSPYAAEYLAYIMINELKEGKEIDGERLIKYIDFGLENEIENSIFQYGYIYEKGIAVSKDNEKAYYYYNIAAEKGCIKAMIKLADWFKIGKFVERNIDIAIKWYEKAAKLKDIEALEKLIEIYELGIGNRKSEIKAVYYVFKLSELDALKGKVKLAYYCYKGIGIEADNEKADEIVQEILEIDRGTANSIIGLLAEEGLINKSDDEIISIYKEGVELGNSECYGNLAEYLYKKNLMIEDKYKELFEIAMEGKKLGINKCKYIFTKIKLEGSMKEETIGVDELILVKQLEKLINKGIYKAINDLINWYQYRKPEDKISYIKLIEDSIYYNL